MNTYDGYKNIHFLEQGGHVLCKEGFQKIVTEEFSNEEGARGPEGEMCISEYEVKVVMGGEALEQLQKEALMHIVDEDESIVKGNCGNVMGITKGKVDYSIKDDKGNVLSKKAAKHMAKYRIRCGECEVNFGTKGKVEPYHIGKSGGEYKKFKKSKKCRYGGEAVPKRKGVKGAFKYIGDNQECLDKIGGSCDKVLKGKHPCKGYFGEAQGLPCLHPECVEKNPEPTLDSNDDTFGSICFISGLGDSPSIQLGCRHIFHVDCIIKKISQKWSGPRITFLFKTCPSCKKDIQSDHPQISSLMQEANGLEEEIKAKALERARAEGLSKDPRLSKPGDEYYGDLQKYAMARMSYYTCFKCKDPYYGGLKEGGNMLEAAGEFKEEELVGGKGSAAGLAGKVNGDKHGKDYIEFKCRYCGSLSQWFGFGTTHFCDPCHRQAASIRAKKGPGPAKCVFKGVHPDNGKEFALGCGLCRNAAFSEL